MFYHIITSVALSLALWHGIKSGQSHIVTQRKSLYDLAKIVVLSHQALRVFREYGYVITQDSEGHLPWISMDRKALSENWKENCNDGGWKGKGNEDTSFTLRAPVRSKSFREHLPVAADTVNHKFISIRILMQELQGHTSSKLTSLNTNASFSQNTFCHYIELCG